MAPLSVSAAGVLSSDSYSKLEIENLLLGDIDFILLVATRTVEEYNSFVQGKLAQIQGVQSIDSRIVIEETKNTTELPLGLI